MSKLTVYDTKGGVKGDIDIPDDLLVLRGGEQAVHDDIVARCARRRAGTASTLRKGEVAGTGKKPWRQKGTGQARAGYRRSPIWRGGSVAFGPHPRSFEKKLSKNARWLAFARALSDKIASGAVKVVDKLEVEQPKTRLVVEILKTLGIKSPVIFIIDSSDANLVRAARNISGVEIVSAVTVDTYRIVRYPVLIVTRSAMDLLKARLQRAA